MSNPNPSPSPDPTPSGSSSSTSPTQTQVVYAGNIAADDLTWIVRLSLPELHRMILAPSGWVSSLGSLPGWNAPAPSLRPDFTLLVERTEAADPQGWVSLQGISATNALTLVASRANGIRSLLYFAPVQDAVAALYGTSLESARAFTDAQLLACPSDPFAPFWSAVSVAPGAGTPSQKTLPVVVAASAGRFSAHFEILDPSDTPVERAARTASFFLAAAGDPSGLQTMLNSLAQEATVVGGAAPDGPISIVVPATTSPSQPSGVSYAGTEGLDDDGSTVCAMIIGTYEDDPQGGQATTTGTLVKRYGVGD